MRKLLISSLVIFASCIATEHKTSTLALNDVSCDAGTDIDSGCDSDSGVDSGSDASIDAGTDSGPPPPTPYAYMVLRTGQSDSLEQAIWNNSVSLYPWTVPSNIKYWHINSSRTLTITNFAPLGGKFGSELSDGKDLSSFSFPTKFSTVAISGSKCSAALVGNPGYSATLKLAIDAMIADLPSGPFPVPLNFNFSQGQEESLLPITSPQALNYETNCLVALNNQITTWAHAIDPTRRIHWNLEQINMVVGTYTSFPSLPTIRAAEAHFCSTHDCSIVDVASVLSGYINSGFQSDGVHYRADSDVTIGSIEASNSVGIP